MKTKDFIDSLKNRIEQHCAAYSISHTRFGVLALNDPSAFKRIGNMTISRLARIEKYLDKNG